ncbi:MAG: alkyl hydroperoxide reductase subunit F [Dysgonamonadaceae bacterium]|jgi:alkyl hydroperoxide reductase subunit F|nr:alkyl hydroperoxide reductase subunit F [Dysgonamonadaceae bacterium]
MLDNDIKQQLQNLFAKLQAQYVLDATVPELHEYKEEFVDFLNDVAASSDHISYRINDGTQLAFSLLKNDKNTGIKFRGIPNGHEFSSFILAVLNSDGQGKNIPDEVLINRVKALKGKINLTTYVSLTCTNCPEIVQSLNLMALFNDNITHEMVDGALYQEEADALNIQAVPSVFADGQLLHVGKSGFGELLEKLSAQYDFEIQANPSEIKSYDVIVIGGGPAGISAAIYSARKGLNVAIIAEKIGGKVNDTVGIENLISIPYITGTQLAAQLKVHAQHYPIDLLEHRRVEKITDEDKQKVIRTSTNERYTAPSIIIATGADWRKLNVPGETEYIGRGVAFCPHCDGPFYKGKHVAVVGGGNSGIEAAIDLSEICSKVTVLEFSEYLRADTVLLEKMKSRKNIEAIVSAQTTEVLGNGEKVTGIRVKDRKTDKEQIINLDGIFVQIGLMANSGVFKDFVTTNKAGEIEIDEHCRTNQPGVYAAGDVTNIPYKQIIISMGEGAKAALSAFEDRIRSVSN